LLCRRIKKTGKALQETALDRARQEAAGEFFETENFPAFCLPGATF